MHPSARKNLLDDILGERSVAQRSYSQGEQSRLVPADQTRERRGVTPPRSRDQLIIAVFNDLISTTRFERVRQGNVRSR